MYQPSSLASNAGRICLAKYVWVKTTFAEYLICAWFGHVISFLNWLHEMGGNRGHREHAQKLHTDSILSSGLNRRPWSCITLPTAPQCHPNMEMVNNITLYVNLGMVHKDMLGSVVWRHDSITSPHHIKRILKVNTGGHVWRMIFHNILICGFKLHNSNT